jgi:hypothetical protein
MCHGGGFASWRNHGAHLPRTPKEKAFAERKEGSEIGIDPTRQIELVRGWSNNRALRAGSHNPIIEAD